MNHLPIKPAPLGAILEGDACVFRVWSTRARDVSVVFFDEAGRATGDASMRALGAGVFEARTPAREGARYMFRVDGALAADPYARDLPEGVHGPAVVRAPRRSISPKRPMKLDGRDVMYEIHVGTFTHEGTFAAARERLADVAELGVTAIELMPLAAFAGARGWGYDGVALFAPHAAYGSPDDLGALVDRAHELGLSMILDVVYNHFGPDGAYAATYSPEYLLSKPGRWGARPNFGEPFMRRMVLDNARYWIEGFGFDGLRLDATHTIVDTGEPHILRALSEMCRAMPGPPVLIAEDPRENGVVFDELHLDGRWNDDFHHAAHRLVTGETDGYYADYKDELRTLARVVACDARTVACDARTVAYAQNHDQIGNRAFGERLHHLLSPELCHALTLLLLFAPSTPLLFMGEEWGCDSPFFFFTDHRAALAQSIRCGRKREFGMFDAFARRTEGELPDPQAHEVFARSRLAWDERAGASHARFIEFYRRAIHLRREDAVLGNSRASTLASVDGDVLYIVRSFEDEHRLFVGSFHHETPLASIAAYREHAWRLIMASPDFASGARSLRGAAIFARRGRATGDE